MTEYVYYGVKKNAIPSKKWFTAEGKSVYSAVKHNLLRIKPYGLCGVKEWLMRSKNLLFEQKKA